MKNFTAFLFATTALAFAGQAAAQLTVYENEGFQGRSFTTDRKVGDAGRAGFNDRASSAVVTGQRWQACENARFEGRCMVLRPGQYPSLTAMGLNDRISSVRPVSSNERIADSAYAPMPVVAQDFRRRKNERLYDAEVTSARAVVGTPGQRCWMEREQVVQHPQQQQSNAGLNVPGALVGAALGGLLGHQVGGGSGKDIATVAGVVGGAALGSQVGQGGRTGTQQATVAQDVRRCDNNPVQATPSYWDVSYNFRGQAHRIQTANAPGRTVVVNAKGEPRI